MTRIIEYNRKSQIEFHEIEPFKFDPKCDWTDKRTKEDKLPKKYRKGWK